LSPAIGPYSSEVVQGQWLLRSVLAMARAGLDASPYGNGACVSRATMYMLGDVNCEFPHAQLMARGGRAWSATVMASLLVSPTAPALICGALTIIAALNDWKFATSGLSRGKFHTPHPHGRSVLYRL